MNDTGTMGKSLLAGVACMGMLAGEAVAGPSLPEKSGGVVSIPAQEWPLKPGPREIKVYISYPGAGIESVDSGSGLMLSLHNWGGTASVGTADPAFLAKKFNVVAISVDYLQSGPQTASKDPYDHGFLQALDALRALHFVFDGLKQRGVAFDSSRIFTCGGSGGGNVSLMSNKLAPHTFTAVVDMCGMKKLGDEIAFNDPPGKAKLNARYSRDPKSPNYLSSDRQELLFVGNPKHLAAMKAQGCSAKIVTVHGCDDDVNLFSEALEYAANMKASGLDFEFIPVDKSMLDGTVYTSTGHPLGNRTLIVEKEAGKYLSPSSPEVLRRKGPSDFELKGVVRYETSGGTWIIDYSAGFPVGSFERR